MKHLTPTADFGFANNFDVGMADWPYNPGSSYWKSPELKDFGNSPDLPCRLIRGEQYGPAIDVWALGSTVRELAEGGPLYYWYVRGIQGKKKDVRHKFFTH